MIEGLVYGRSVFWYTGKEKQDGWTTTHVYGALINKRSYGSGTTGRIERLIIPKELL